MLVRQRLINLLWPLPAVALLAVFLYYPLVDNFRLSFLQWGVFEPDPQFVGFSNFQRAFTDPIFWTAVGNNVAYALVSLVVQVGGGLVLAAVIDRFVGPRLRGFFRSVYFLPATLSITIVGVLFSFIYNPQVGLLNGLLDALGLDALTRTWLGDPETAMAAIIAMSQWQWTGYVAALLLVAIQRIPGELYEATSLDGAGGLRQFFTITVPLTREMVTVMSIVTVSNAFLVFNEVVATTNGGPNNSTQVLGTLVYQNAFVNDDAGYAAALSVLILILTMSVSFIQLYISNRKQVQF